MAITPERVRELFDYDPESGRLVWRVPHGSGGRIPAGSAAGTLARDGSLVVRFDGQTHRVHRLVWLHVHGASPAEIDHRNHNPADNRLANLRACTREENTRNVRRHKDTASGMKGVYATRNGRWYSRIFASGKNRVLGTFDTKGQAARAYDAAARELHGEFAKTNEG